MRMATFLMGGIAGAAAAIYVSRNRDKVWSGLVQAAGSAQKMMSNSKVFGFASATSQTGASSEPKQPEAKTAGSIADNTQTSKYQLKDVEEIVSKDPELTATVQEILEHNQNQKSEFSPIRS
ncbi:Uncharacterised protein [Chlamydia abortus]|uniref:Uncharacterized protein n=1 Tax=Paenibacillus residui TaxID=629724 RepID=A0ABW3D2X3_9BACL|nr:hypothetical protein [Aneurinibacillus sp. XH2]SHE11059.1 Uncharacterised protein [Chlamydia abortus]